MSSKKTDGSDFFDHSRSSIRVLRHRLLFSGKSLKAGFADKLAFEFNEIGFLVAEDTIFLVLDNDNTIVVRRQLEDCSVVETKTLSELLRNNDSSERVDFAQTPCGIHSCTAFS